MKKYAAKVTFEDNSEIVEDITFPSVDWFLCRYIDWFKHHYPERWERLETKEKTVIIKKPNYGMTVGVTKIGDIE